MCDTSCNPSAKGTIMWNKDKLLTRLEADSCLNSVRWVIEKGICRDLERLPSLRLCPQAGPTLLVIPKAVTSSLCLLLCGQPTSLSLNWLLDSDTTSKLSSIHPWISSLGCLPDLTGQNSRSEFSSPIWIQYSFCSEQEDRLNEILRSLLTWMILCTNFCKVLPKSITMSSVDK